LKKQAERIEHNRKMAEQLRERRQKEYYEMAQAKKRKEELEQLEEAKKRKEEQMQEEEDMELLEAAMAAEAMHAEELKARLPAEQ
jgi:hypothetical protein